MSLASPAGGYANARVVHPQNSSVSFNELESERSNNSGRSRLLPASHGKEESIPSDNTTGEEKAERRVPSKETIDVASAQFKTRLCRDYEQKGWCSWGQMCIFAHGRHELRSLSDNERMGITNDLAVQRERAKLLTDTRQDRLPRMHSAASATTATTTPYGPKPTSTDVVFPQFMFDLQTCTAYYASPTISPMIPTPYSMAPGIAASTIPMPATLFPCSIAAPMPIASAGFPSPPRFSHLRAPVGSTPQNAMSPNAPPFVPAGFVQAADITLPVVMPTSEMARKAGAGDGDDDDDDDVISILRGVVDGMQHSSQDTSGKQDSTPVEAAEYHLEDKCSETDRKARQILNEMSFMR